MRMRRRCRDRGQDRVIGVVAVEVVPGRVLRDWRARRRIMGVEHRVPGLELVWGVRCIGDR
jgi:hypothetical protein